jgi:hypothetical protein
MYNRCYEKLWVKEGGRGVDSQPHEFSPPLVQPPKNFMKNTNQKQESKPETKQMELPEWPKRGKTAPGRQPQNPRILRVDIEGVVVNVSVRNNSFYRANEPVVVGKDPAGALVDVKPKTSVLLHGGYEG